MTLPIFQSDIKELSLMQTNWAAELNPILKFPINSGVILKNVVLSASSNTINHLLQRKLIGWFIVRQRALASIYDTQDLNATPSVTLLLTSSAVVTVDIFVF